jgi:hypothetical protein
MRAIAFDLGVDKLLTIRYGESQFKTINGFWTDFTPLGGEKTTIFKSNIVKWSEKNDQLVQAIKENYAEAKRVAGEFDKKMFQLRNQFEK